MENFFEKRRVSYAIWSSCHQDWVPLPYWKVEVAMVVFGLINTVIFYAIVEFLPR